MSKHTASSSQLRSELSPYLETGATSEILWRAPGLANVNQFTDLCAVWMPGELENPAKKCPHSRLWATRIIFSQYHFCHSPTQLAWCSYQGGEHRCKSRKGWSSNIRKMCGLCHSSVCCLRISRAVTYQSPKVNLWRFSFLTTAGQEIMQYPPILSTFYSIILSCILPPWNYYIKWKHFNFF